jgi:hypothetical protein
MFVVFRLGVLCGLVVATGVFAQTVAGLQPDRRPQGAPVLRTDAVEPAIKSQRLTGVVTPWPGNVERIAEQGQWYSPMFRPGMTGPYDLRGWHTSRER